MRDIPPPTSDAVRSDANNPQLRQLVATFDRLIRRDPGRRGLIGDPERLSPLCPDHLACSAAHLASHARHVGIVTGFYVPHGVPPSAETDGPPGCVLLARTLLDLGIEVTLITDEFCLPAVRAAVLAARLDHQSLVPYDPAEPGWVDEFLTTRPGRTLTHLLAVERVGPSHTRESLLKQLRSGAIPLEDFLRRVPAESYGLCHNMRGLPIDAHTPDLHRLFDRAEEIRPDLTTIGIGDGGNEIGMGTILWEELVARLQGEHSARIPCRIATHWTILAGTSNWGCYALAAAVAALRGTIGRLAPFTAAHEFSVLEQMVQNGPSVDGATGRQEATVDGLPFLTYIQPWEGIRRELGLDG